MPRVDLPVILTLILLSLAAPLAVAQSESPEQTPQDSTEAESPPPTPVAPEEPEGIPRSKLAASVEEGNAKVRDLRAKVAAIPATKTVVDRLPDTARLVGELELQREELNLETLSLQRLDLMHQQWVRLDTQLKDWQAKLERRSDDLGQADTTLNEMRERWKTVAELAEASGVPEELLGQVRSVQRSIDEVDRQIGERLSAVLTLLGRVTQLRTTVIEAVASIEVARELARKRILSPDSPPIWTAVARRGQRISISQQIRHTWEQDSEQFRIFMNVYRQRVPLQLLAFVATAIVMILVWLRIRKRKEDEEDPAIRSAMLIFSRPISSALILTVAASRVFYPQAPIVVFDTILLFGLVPLLRLVPRMVAPGIRPAIYGIAGLFALQQFHALAADRTLLERLTLLVTSAAGLAWSIWLFRRGKVEAGSRPGSWQRATLVALGLACSLFLVAVLANVIGSVELAELLTEATVLSAVAGIALAVCSRILEALVTVLLRSRSAAATGMVSRHGEIIARRLTSLIRLAALTAWVAGTLNLFRLLQETLSVVGAALARTWTLGNLTISLGSVLAFFSAIFVAVFISRFIRFVLEEDVFPRLPLQRGVPSILSMLINYTILTLGFLSAMAVAGIEVSQFAIIFGALGVGIGFGLQNVVNNFISGLILVFERPIKIGDTIEVGPIYGEVRRIGIRSSTVRTFEGAEVIVPNGNLISAEVTNWTLSDRIRRIKIPAGVAYGTDPQKVLEILREVAKKNKDALGIPEPYALFKGFGASSLDFELRFWTANFDDWPRVASAVTVSINKALAEAGIEIPFPQRDLHLRSVESSVEEAITRARPLESDRGGH